MYAQYLLIDYRAYREAVEDVAEDLPQPYGVSTLAHVVETIYPVDPRQFVTAPQYEEILRIHDLVAYQETHSLEGLLALVDKIPQEEVVALGGESAVLKQPQEVRDLPVDVTTYFFRGALTASSCYDKSGGAAEGSVYS
jgi:hypothetical protein